MKYLQNVKCKAKLKRKDVKRLRWKVWERSWQRKEQDFNGVIIGKRTLHDGKVIYDEVVLFEPERSFTAYLVSFSMSRNPVYVLPEDIEKL